MSPSPHAMGTPNISEIKHISQLQWIEEEDIYNGLGQKTTGRGTNSTQTQQDRHQYIDDAHTLQ